MAVATDDSRHFARPTDSCRRGRDHVVRAPASGRNSPIGAEPDRDVTRSVALVSTIAVGLLVGLQPVANAAMAEHVGDLGAAFVSLVVAAVLIGILLLVVGDPGRLVGGVGEIRPEYLIGALGGAAVVSIGLVAVGPLGAGAVIAVLVAGQVVIAVIADRMGWFGLHHVGLGAGRVLGVVLVIAGTALVVGS